MDSGFQKKVDFIFFGFNAFLCTSFSCSNLAILKDVVTRHSKFVFFFDLQNSLASDADVLRDTSRVPAPSWGRNA